MAAEQKLGHLVSSRRTLESNKRSLHETRNKKWPPFLNSMIFQKNNFFWTKSFFLRQLDRVWINSINSFASRQNLGFKTAMKARLSSGQLERWNYSWNGPTPEPADPGSMLSPRFMSPKPRPDLKKCRYISVTKKDSLRHRCCEFWAWKPSFHLPEPNSQSPMKPKAWKIWPHR